MTRLIFTCLFALVFATAAVSETLVTNRAVRAGEVLGPGDLTVAPAQVSGALRSFDQAVGLQAVRNLFPGRALFVEDLREPHLVERNQVVTLSFFRGGLSIVTEGRAMDGGAVGDVIRVMNAGSRKTVMGRVLIDGTISVTGGGF